MKNLLGIASLIACIGLGSCGKDSMISWKTEHSFVIENMDGEEIDFIQDLDAHAVVSNGYSSNEATESIRGTYVAGSTSTHVDGTAVGFKFHLIYNHKFDGEEVDFTDDLFHELWSEGAVHHLGKEGEGLYDNPFIYVGLLQEDGSVKKYVTQIIFPDDESQLEVISKEYQDQTENGRDVYLVKVLFNSSMVNMDDETDIIAVKDGIAILKVPNFSQEKTN